jgi:hypothetical protein
MLIQSKQCLPFVPSFRFMPIKVRSLQNANAESALKSKLLSQRNRWSNFWYSREKQSLKSTVLETLPFADTCGYQEQLGSCSRAGNRMQMQAACSLQRQIESR